MKLAGLIALAVALIGALFALSMDATVDTGIPGNRIVNVGLLNDKQNYLIASCAIGMVGAILFVAGLGWRPEHGDAESAKSSFTTFDEERSCPFCAERIKAKARVCRHCNRELSNQVSLPKNASDVSQLSPADVDTPGHCIALLQSIGYQVKSPASNVWEIAHSSGSIAYARTPKDLVFLTAKYLDSAERRGKVGS